MSAGRGAWLGAGLAGALFGAGLVISGMTDPARIVGFLDITRRWDPALAFVMAGAVIVYAIAYRLTVPRAHPVFARAFRVPPRAPIDRRLVAGAAVFGIGWGLAGLCPGPALVDAAAGSWPAIVFVLAMLLGMQLARVVKRRRDRGSSP